MGDTMKFAIVSDMHFGYDKCVLLDEDKQGNISRSDKYREFAKAVGEDNDYLIVVGDVFDFSVASYEKAYRHGKNFFDWIRQDKLVKLSSSKKNSYGPVVYVAGNHDADVWHIVQHERSVINRFNHKPAQLPKEYQHSVPGILDLRHGSRGFWLRNTTVNTAPGEDSYGGMFLDNITDPKTVFYFAYPNLYIVFDDSTSVLVTHGQYLESYWSLAGELATNVAYDKLKLGGPVKTHMDLEKMVEFNYPL
ncbi:MAG TPA: metallophosphoesterase, partial [Syntrophorhabdaceae bacterium]|nr:metallophosphoesterase [Syntrophorhabdaceae bacterium]